MKKPRIKRGDVIEIRYSEDVFVYGRTFSKAYLDIGIYDYLGTGLENISVLRSHSYRFFMIVLPDDEYERGVLSVAGNLRFGDGELSEFPPTYRVMEGDQSSPDAKHYYVERGGKEVEVSAEEVKGLLRFQLFDAQDLLQRIASEFGLPPSPYLKTSDGSEQAAEDWDSFSNDDAFEWIDALTESDPAFHVRSALLTVAEAPEDSDVGVTDARAAVAAADVVAWSAGRPPRWMPDLLEEWTESEAASRSRLVLAGLKPEACRALNRILVYSELADLWGEAPMKDRWLGAIRELLERLA